MGPPFPPLSRLLRHGFPSSLSLSLSTLYIVGTCSPVLASRGEGGHHRVHILVEMKQGECICPHSWSVHCNFTGEGKCNERGWACTPHPHQPGQILPSSLNVRQKAAVATLCTLWCILPFLSSLASADGSWRAGGGVFGWRRHCTYMYV